MGRTVQQTQTIDNGISFALYFKFRFERFAIGWFFIYFHSYFPVFERRSSSTSLTSETSFRSSASTVTSTSGSFGNGRQTQAVVGHRRESSESVSSSRQNSVTGRRDSEKSTGSQSTTTENIRQSSGSVGANRERSESVGSNRQKSGSVGTNRESSGSFSENVFISDPSPNLTNTIVTIRSPQRVTSSINDVTDDQRITQPEYYDDEDIYENIEFKKPEEMTSSQSDEQRALHTMTSSSYVDDDVMYDNYQEEVDGATGGVTMRRGRSTKMADSWAPPTYLRQGQRIILA